MLRGYPTVRWRDWPEISSEVKTRPVLNCRLENSPVNKFMGEVTQTTAAISLGSSGGGLFDRYGRLVGITTFPVEQGQNLNFAILCREMIAAFTPATQDYGDTAQPESPPAASSAAENLISAVGGGLLFLRLPPRPVAQF